MWRAVASNAITLLIFAILLVSGVVYWGQSMYKGQGPLEQAVCYRVEPGSLMGKVSQDLLEINAIKDDRIFRIGADYENKSNQLNFIFST